MTGLFKNLNCAAPNSNDEARLKKEIEALDRSVPLITAGHDASISGQVDGAAQQD